MSLPTPTGDPLSDEWVQRVYAILRENNGTIAHVLETEEEDFTRLPPQAQDHLRDLTEELLGSLAAPGLAA